MEKDLDINEENETADGAENVRETPEVDSKYRMILLAAQRSKQLQRGATPRIAADSRKMKPTRIAMEELKRGKVHFEILAEEGTEEDSSVSE